MKQYNRELLSYEDFMSIRPELLCAFKEFTPRSHFIKNNKALEERNHQALDTSEQPNILSYPTTLAPHLIQGIDSFDDVFKNTTVYELIKEKFEWVNNYVTENTTGVKNSFITFSTNITGAEIGVKHLHSLLNGDGCNVWSFAVPLYIDATCDDSVGFWYNSQQDLFPPRYYIDYKRIKQLDIEYTSFKLPKDGKIMSVMFDGSRSPHYIDYKNLLYAFMVFDGIEIEHKLGKKWITELL
jgi:hypothetical protein